MVPQWIIDKNFVSIYEEDLENFFINHFVNLVKQIYSMT